MTRKEREEMEQELRKIMMRMIGDFPDQRRVEDIEDEGIKQKALHYMRTTRNDEIYTDLTDEEILAHPQARLKAAFIWKNTDEGHEFWENVWDSLPKRKAPVDGEEPNEFL